MYTNVKNCSLIETQGINTIFRKALNGERKENESVILKGYQKIPMNLAKTEKVREYAGICPVKNMVALLKCTQSSMRRIGFSIQSL